MLARETCHESAKAKWFQPGKQSAENRALQVGVLSKYAQIMLLLLAVAFQDLHELHKEIKLSMFCFAAQMPYYTLES